MQKIKDLNSFELNEKFTDFADSDIKLVRDSSVKAIGSSDSPTRRAILDMAFSLYSHFDSKKDKQQFMQAVIAMDKSGREKVLNSTKAYAHTLQKIRKIEVDEIQPNQEGLEAIINQKPE